MRSKKIYKTISCRSKENGARGHKKREPRFRRENGVLDFVFIIRDSRAICVSARGAAISAALSLRSGGCARASRQTFCQLLPAYGFCHLSSQSAIAARGLRAG